MRKRLLLVLLAASVAAPPSCSLPRPVTTPGEIKVGGS